MGTQSRRVAGENDANRALFPSSPVTIIVMSSPTTGLRLSYVTPVIVFVLVWSVSYTFVKPNCFEAVTFAPSPGSDSYTSTSYVSLSPNCSPPLDLR